MHLAELLKNHSHRPKSSVPDWMLGAFERKSITFANGYSDTSTQVYWIQGRNQTIDLRLPARHEIIQKTSADCSDEELARLADYEGWSADSYWNGTQLSWSSGQSFQLYNRWPEPGILQRVGNCMIEFSPNRAYVEDWRIRSITKGPLVSLKVLEEREDDSNQVLHYGGSLIIAGNWAALVLGRSETPIIGAKASLRDILEQTEKPAYSKKKIFNFETSVATGNILDGYTIVHSTDYSRVGHPLISLEGFKILEHDQQIVQKFKKGEVSITRNYQIDTLEEEFLFSESTAWTTPAQAWFNQEQQTLSRYLDKL